MPVSRRTITQIPSVKYLPIKQLQTMSARRHQKSLPVFRIGKVAVQSLALVACRLARAASSSAHELSCNDDVDLAARRRARRAAIGGHDVSIRAALARSMITSSAFRFAAEDDVVLPR